MAITIRVPDPTEEYNAGNQRQIVRFFAAGDNFCFEAIFF